MSLKQINQALTCVIQDDNYLKSNTTDTNYFITFLQITDVTLAFFK